MPSKRTFGAELFATANLEKLRALSEKRILRRALSGRDVLSIGLGAMIGGGIFTTIGPGVRMAGPAILIAYLLAAAASFFAALAYAEIGSMVPIAGSAYTYAYATLGKLVAWLIGFALIFEYGISGAPVAQQFSGAIQDMLHQAFGFTTPFWMQRSHLVISGAWWIPSSWDFAHSQYDVIGAAFIIVLAGLLTIGIRETATANNIFNIFKLGALAVFLIAGLTMIHPNLWTPFAPHGWGSLRPFSGGAGIGVIPAAALVFFNYIGFDSTTTVSEECRDPQRDLPFGIIGSLTIGTVIYCAVAVVLVGIVPWQHVDETHALARAVEPLHNPFVNWAIIVGVLAGTASVAISAVLGQTRIFYVMARDNMLPPAFASVNKRFKTPMRMTILVGLAIAVLTLIVPLDYLLNLVNIGTLLAFVVVCAGVIYLRYKRPEIPRTFRSPFVPLFPLLGICFCTFLAVYGLDRTTWIWFVGALVAGLAVFFIYGFRNSDPDDIVPVEEPEALLD
ncbi:MAG TPA: amino acid permease [Candidatus Baltobacteraceae bacterium]|nr:amino acid permease [Candidatus Baltobacteraceae bacterium]